MLFKTFCYSMMIICFHLTIYIYAWIDYGIDDKCSDLALKSCLELCKNDVYTCWQENHITQCECNSCDISNHKTGCDKMCSFNSTNIVKFKACHKDSYYCTCSSRKSEL